MRQTSPDATASAIREEERRRISRELHNSTSQLLVALQLQLGELRRSHKPSAEPLLAEMAQVIRDIHISLSQIGSRPSGEAEDDDGAKVVIARAFYSLGARNRSAQ